MRKDLLKSKTNHIFASAIAKVAQLVEHNLAKVRVAGSSPVFRSIRPDGGMVDTKDLKSFDHCGCAGSSPAPGTGRQVTERCLPVCFYMVCAVLQTKERCRLLEQ